MKRSWCWRSLSGGLRGGLQAAALVSFLSGCSLTDSVFGGSSSATPEPVPGPAAQAPAQTAPQPAAQPTQGQTYPNLGTVPAQAPATSTSADRQQVTSGLVADSQNAAYSDQPVTAQQTATPAPAPIPAPTPVASATDSAALPAGTPQPPAQPTVSQTTTSQTPTTGQIASQAPAIQPSATVLPQPVTPPMPTAGATPLAPPPNPVPPASAGSAMTADQGSVIVDTSQLGGAPLPGYVAAPYSAPVGALAAAGRPVAIVFFADASAGLSDRDRSVLHDVYLIQQQQGGRLRIVGHASLHTAPLDPARHDQVNTRLSAIRANAVARALIGMGVPEGTLSVVAEGSKAPVFYEFMPTGEAGNRRVEIYLDR